VDKNEDCFAFRISSGAVAAACGGATVQGGKAERLNNRILERLVRVTPARPWSPVRSAATALACVAVAFLGRTLLDPLLGDSSPFGLFLLAVVGIGYFCGGLYAAAASVLSAVLCVYFFLSPRYSFATATDATMPIAVFIFLCFVLTAAAVLLRTAVSQLNERQRELQESGERARQIANLSPQIVWSARRNGVPDYYNDRWYEYSGANPDITPTGWDPFVHPDDVADTHARWAEALKLGAPYESEMRLRRHDGEYRWFVARALPFEDSRGAVTRWYGTCTDIHDAKTSIEKLQALKLQLEQSENRFREIADLSPQITWSTLPDGHHDYYNKRWYEFTGMPDGSTDGEGWNGMFHPEDQPLAWEKWNHSLKTGEPYEIEYRLRRHDGEYLWFLGRALPMRDAKGAIVRWFGTCTDIHDRKMALAMMETLSHELSHRIKNIFAVVTSLIALSLRNSPDAKPFAAQLRKRIDALGRAHDFARPHSDASRPTAPEPTIFALVRILMEPYAADVDDRLVIEGEDIAIADRVATPVALIIHELATNATKYGALSADSGKVFISGSRIADNYELTWREAGGPPVAAPDGALGFGSRLLDVSAGGQLGGEVERFWEPEGVRVVVRVPIASVERHADSLG